MAERYNRAKLEEFSKQVFEQNPHLDRVYATEDGQFFGERSKSDATNYARQTQQELIVIERLQSNDLASAVAEPEVLPHEADAPLGVACEARLDVLGAVPDDDDRALGPQGGGGQEDVL